MVRHRHEHPFLPTTLAEVRARGWDAVDVVIVSGDAYVDHPAFGPVLIARFLEGRGLRVGFLAQPDWRSADDFRRLGRPRLFFGIAAGNLDSMLNRLTAQKKNRSEDQYSPGGATNARPDRATLVYSHRAREAYPDVPIVLGGIEASLRRIAHYDYWSDTVRRPILLDAKADLLIFGMGERPVWEVAQRLKTGEPIERIRDVRGTAWPMTSAEADAVCAYPSAHVTDGRALELPAYEEIAAPTPEGKAAYARAARLFHHETNPYNARPLVQRSGGRAVYFNPPALPLETEEMDALYDLPFNRAPHPSYDRGIPAFETVKHSLVAMRGCFGGCTFCSITEHEGRIIQNRSAESILREVRALRRMDDFRGVISDLGGPTANMYAMRCEDEKFETKCRRLSCVHPEVCEHLKTDHGPLIDLMKKVREADGVRKVHIASGVRYDLAQLSPEYMRELTKHHVGGQLSVAPEHTSPATLKLMKKPTIDSYERFADQFKCASQEAGKDQYLVPYFISGHPGSTLADMVQMALYLKEHNLRPRQVQDFIPTPMSLAATMYYTGLDPLSGAPCYTARGLREKRLQKALLLYWDPAQAPLVRAALVQAKRNDLIGHGPGCLVPPGAISDGDRPGGPKRPRLAKGAYPRPVTPREN
ncbi:MAG: YgiQ family radical SAM protein [Myxococcales bacterium]|nr:YgiQ family radical SAM protein [Myxococcales bacterium]